MNYTKLTDDLKVANQKACEAVKDSDDGGTANLDSVFLTIPRAPELNVLEAIKAAGLYCRGKRKWIGQGYMITPTVGGQGNVRTRAVQVMAKELCALGWDAAVYYQMD